MIKMNKCDICPNNCDLDGKTVCGRSSGLDENIIETTAIAIDPIEKKPLYHFMPGTQTLSVGTLGCNLRCLNCQNHSIAQPADASSVPTRSYSPEEIVEMALDNKLKSISWTYNEASIHPEWIINTAKIAREYDIKSILVTNGYTSGKTLEKLVHFVDAVNVDLKSSKDEFYKTVCGGRLEYVLESIKYYFTHEIHVEVTTLIIPGYNSDGESINGVIDYIKSLSCDIPLHFSAFYPQYKLMNVEATSDELVFEACKNALDKGLNYVYAGNTYPSRFDNTYCSECSEEIIERDYYHIKNNLKKGLCPNCGKDNNIIL